MVDNIINIKIKNELQNIFIEIKELRSSYENVKEN